MEIFVRDGYPFETRDLREQEAGIEALKNQKVREGAILSSDDDDENDNIYDVVTEEQYKKIVNDRRKGEEFVVDDDGTGYYDHGEEVLFDVAEGEEANFSKEASIKDPRARQRMRQQRKKASLNAAAAKGNHKLGAMFLGMSGHTSPSKKRQKTAVDAAEDLDLDAELTPGRLRRHGFDCHAPPCGAAAEAAFLVSQRQYQWQNLVARTKICRVQP